MTFTGTTTRKIVAHRNGDVSADGVKVGRITRSVEPIGRVRPNGTRRHVVRWSAWRPDGEIIARHTSKALAVRSVDDWARYSAR